MEVYNGVLKGWEIDIIGFSNFFKIFLVCRSFMLIMLGVMLVSIKM